MPNIIAGNSLIVAEWDSTPIDILGRDALIDQIKMLINTLSVRKSPCSFAIDGKWGIGKSFVLGRLENDLRCNEHYLVFHYNCWQYDYYDEPLIAIVSAMLDNMDEQVNLVSQKNVDMFKKSAAFFATALKNIAVSYVKSKTGLDFSEGISDAIESQEKLKEELHNNHSYDSYYTFNKVLKCLKAQLMELASDRTLIIVVDELDRCLPEYTIKVLERLHHLFSAMKNTVVIMAVDQSQLKATIQKLLGTDEIDAYLRKFIDFKIPLDTGVVNDSFLDKFNDYISMFDVRLLKEWGDLNDYIRELFSGIDIRTQTHLIERVSIAHSLVYINEKADYSIMCFELLMVVYLFRKRIADPGPPLEYIRNSSGRYSLKTNNDLSDSIKRFIKDKWNYTVTTVLLLGNNEYPTFSGELDIPHLIIGYSEAVFSSHAYLLSHTPKEIHLEKIIDNLSKVRHLLELIS